MASVRALAACSARRAAPSTTSATSTATTTMATRVTTFFWASTLSVYTGSVKKKFSSRALSTEATSAGPSPPTRATTTVAKKKSTTLVEKSSSRRSSTPTVVASSGHSTASSQPASCLGSASGLRPSMVRMRPPECAWVTMCTSIGPDRCSTAAPMPSSNSRASRDRRDVPSTSWVALTPLAKSSSAVGTSSPTTVCQEAPTSSASRRNRPTVPDGTPARPSPRSTCSTSRSAPARLAIRLARRISVSLSGPPVIAATTRSRVSQVSVIRFSAR